MIKSDRALLRSSIPKGDWAVSEDCTTIITSDGEVVTATDPNILVFINMARTAIPILLDETEEKPPEPDMVLRAWVDEGSHKQYHRRMRKEVRRLMPILGSELDKKAGKEGKR